MKHLRLTTGILAVAFIALTATSCKDSKKEHVDEDSMHTEMHEKQYEEMKNESEEHHHEDADDEHDGGSAAESRDIKVSTQKNAATSAIIDGYLQIKNGLVTDNRDKAIKGATAMMLVFDDFEVGMYAPDDQEKLITLIAQGKAQAASIVENSLEVQRKHFKELNLSVTDMVAITGTRYTLYEQHCPMYDNGSSWLSASSAIKNPYYGSKMLNCGTVEREIN